MVMMHRYQRKSCAQLARAFGVSAAEAYDIIARRQVGGCCG
jgi:transposase